MTSINASSRETDLMTLAEAADYLRTPSRLSATGGTSVAAPPASALAAGSCTDARTSTGGSVNASRRRRTEPTQTAPAPPI